MVEVSNNFIQECEANVGTYKFGKIKVNYIDDNPLNYEQGAYSSSNGAKIDAEQSIRYNKLVECEPNFKYKIELGNSTTKMKIVTYNANQEFIAVHDNLIQGSELTTEATARYISVTIYSNDTLEGTAITLNGTIRNGEILGAELKGNTTQDSTPTPSSPVPVNNVTGEQVVRVCGKNLLQHSAYDRSLNGITLKVNNDKSITLTGTATANTNFNIGTNADFTLGAGTYTFSKVATNVQALIYYSSASVLANLPIGTQTKTFTLNNDTTYNNYRVVISIPNGTTVNETVYPMLEKNTTVTTYEPYQGKDYEINLGNIELNKIGNYQDFIRKGSGKNLIEPKMATTTQNGITCTNNGDGTFTLNGTATAQATFRINQSTYNAHDNLKNYNGTYTFSCDQLQADMDLILMQNNTWSIALRMNGSNTPVTGNINKDNCFIYVQVRNGKSVNNLTIRPMLEKGSSATSFEPYACTGKNLFDNSADIVEGYTFGAMDNLIADTRFFYQNSYIPVSPNTSYCVAKPSSSSLRVCEYNQNKEFIQRDYEKYVFTTTSNTYFVRVSDYIAVKDLIQLEQGTQPTSFEPYIYSTLKDKWYIEKNTLKIIVPNAVTGTMQNSNKRFYVNGRELGTGNILRNTSSSQTYGLYCDILEEKTAGQTWAGTQGISYDYNSGQNIGCIDFAITGLTTIAEYQNALKGKTIIAIANTPTYTLIDNEELIEQLDAVSHAETQEGITNIMTMGDLPAILDVMPDLTESIRGKQTTPIVGYNITGEDDLINFKITSKADSNGNILGATSQSQVDIEIFNENNAHNLENKQVYISTGLNETEGNYCKWQPFTITQTKDTQTKNHTTYTGYDDMMRGNEAYIDNVDYGEEGITLYDFTCNLAKEMGMALGNTMMTNGEFIVKGNNFTNNETKLVVLKNIAQMVGGFAMIDRDNLLRIVELSPEYAMTPIELTTNLYTEDFQNSAKFGEINEFAIGETNIETNAIVRSDDASIAKNGVKKIEILDNMFLGLLEDKETAIEPLWDAFNGFSYYPFKTPYNGYPYIDLGDKVNITDINSNVYSTLVLNNVFEYNGGYKGNIGAEALSITAAKYKTNNTLGKQFRKVGIEIDRVEGKITSEIDAATDGITKAYNTAISQTEKNIKLSVTEINKVISGDPAVEGDTGLEGTVNKINQTYLTVDSNDFTVVSSTATEAKKKADAVEENTQKIVSQLHFDAETGLTISAEGSTDDDMKLNLTNSQVNFMYRNSPVLVINGNKIEFTGATFQKFDLGNYVWQAEDDDSLSLIYEGD